MTINVYRRGIFFIYVRYQLNIQLYGLSLFMTLQKLNTKELMSFSFKTNTAGN